MPSRVQYCFDETCKLHGAVEVCDKACPATDIVPEASINAGDIDDRVGQICQFTLVDAHGLSVERKGEPARLQPALRAAA